MHQPDYRDQSEAGEFVLPWVYLHAIKDYADMASHLERHPDIRCVVNFVPVLLDQIEDYANQFARGEFRDPLLRLLARESLDGLTDVERERVLQACFRSNHHTMLAPFPRYQRLHDLYLHLTHSSEIGYAYLSGAYFSDLLTWYHLAWTGEDARRNNAVIAGLMSKGGSYGYGDRKALLTAMGELVTGIIPRYRALADRGQIELSATPETHPLSPLLIDFKAARESLPDAALPFAECYPGGRDRVSRQIADARGSHALRFGQPPTGMWPAEGAVSDVFAQHLAQAGCRWIASGEGVLRASLHTAGIDPQRAAWRPWTLAGAPGLTLFFRDERLSDLIGFDYAKWHGRDAAAHLLNELEGIVASTPEGETAVVGIILDGENAWEHYPYNGYFFFEDLYGMLAAHPRIRTRTYADIASRPEQYPASELPRLVAGSWVYGTLSTWIGDAQKNLAWDMLCAAKQSYDRVLGSGRLNSAEAAQATRQLAICESSDWFWWFGDYNPAEAVASFDRLFRHNLARLYVLLKLAAPCELDQPISCGTVGAEMSTMRRATMETEQS
jgi:alpha-amylase/alpha-mannosidase (GH57 family)